MHKPWLRLLLFLVISTSVSATDLRELTWDDLIPEGTDFEDPFTALNDYQLYGLGQVVRAREQQAAGKAISEEELKRVAEAEAELKAEGVDIDGLLARRAEITEKRRRRAQAVNTELDGETVRMPGYLLPLEYTGKKVTEFLLVPWVGACIHTPPPPPNQIVHVKLTEGYETSGGLFAPVWVNGVMRTESSSPELSLVDGSANIATGYALQASGVEPYAP
jgi:hypothetical protein